MGSFLSTSPDPAEGTGLGDLPESCAASILWYLEPTDVCRLGGLNRAFRGASWADVVWETKLPENYGVIVEEVFGGLIGGGDLCKREIYTRLCGDHTFDGGTKKVWLDKSTGQICLSVCAKGLEISRVDDRRYWNYISTTESRFGAVAYLQQTWWLQAEGEVEFPFPKGNYSVFFRLQLGKTARRFPGRRVCDCEHVHGWDKKPVRFQLSTSDGHLASSQCFLANPGKWVNYHVGDFNVRSHGIPTKNADGDGAACWMRIRTFDALLHCQGALPESVASNACKVEQTWLLFFYADACRIPQGRVVSKQMLVSNTFSLIRIFPCYIYITRTTHKKIFLYYFDN